MEQSGAFARFSPYLDHFVEFDVRDGAVVRVTFPENLPEDAEEDHPLLDRIEDYLTGTVRETFESVDVSLDLPEDHRTVLEVVREIPYGESTRVKTIARRTGLSDPEDPETATAIREYLAENPVPLVIPDHRVRDGPSGAPPVIEQRLRALEAAG